MAQPIPPGFHSITPHLTVRTSAAEYLTFLERAFGAQVLERSEGPGGKIMHAKVRIGDSFMMCNDAFPEFGMPHIAEGHWPIKLHLYVKDVDAAFSRATEAGCTVTFPLMDQFWGDRYGQVRDPFGFEWAIATHREDVSPEELKKRAASAFGANQ